MLPQEVKAHKPFKEGATLLHLHFSRNSWVLAFSAAVWNIGGGLVNPYTSLFFYALGTPVELVGFLAAFSSLATALAYAVGGVIADAYGRKRVIAVFSVVAAASSFLYVFVFSWPLLLVPITVGALSGIYSPAFSATINDSLEPPMRPLGFASFTLVTTTPMVLAPPLGGLLVERFGTLTGLKIGFFVSGLLGLVATVWRSKKLEETYRGPDPGDRWSFSSVLGSFSGILRAYKMAGREAKKLLLYTLLASIATGLSTVYVSIYVISSLKLSAVDYGVLVSLSALATVFLIMPAAGLVRRLGLKRAAVLSALFSPLSMLFFVSAVGMTDLLAWSVTGGIGGALLSPSIQSLQGNLTPTELRGRWMAMYSLVPLLVSAPFQALSGVFYSISPIFSFALSVPFYALSVIILADVKARSPWVPKEGQGTGRPVDDSDSPNGGLIVAEGCLHYLGLPDPEVPPHSSNNPVEEDVPVEQGYRSANNDQFWVVGNCHVVQAGGSDVEPVVDELLACRISL